jgi:hypothetical protein
VGELLKLDSILLELAGLLRDEGNEMIHNFEGLRPVTASHSGLKLLL